MPGRASCLPKTWRVVLVAQKRVEGRDGRAWHVTLRLLHRQRRHLINNGGVETHVYQAHSRYAELDVPPYRDKTWGCSLGWNVLVLPRGVTTRHRNGGACELAPLINVSSSSRNNLSRERNAAWHAACLY